MIFKDAVIDVMKNVPGFREELIEVPPDPSMGDFAYPCFTLAKSMKKNPSEIAADLAKLKFERPIEKITNSGPYLNFFINQEDMAKAVLSSVDEDHAKKVSGKKVMVEYSSPNTNKPLHLGHLRNIATGKAISNILEFTGDKVIQSCVVNDRGIHICKSMLMYMRYGKDQEPDKKPDHFVGDFYVMFNIKAKENPDILEDAKSLLIRWEKGDEKVRKIWKLMNNWAIEGFDQTYERLGIRFDKIYLESEIYKGGKDIIKKGVSEGILKKEDGAIIADLERFGLGKKVLMRSDGTSLYITQDIGLAKLKFDEFDLDKSIYVVGSEQDLHFRQLFCILDMLGFGFAKHCHHLSYGMVYLPEGKMKSREGIVVDADNLLDEMYDLAEEEITKRHKLDPSEVEKRSKIISLGALKFFLLKTDPNKDMTYDPRKSISFEGETGPYVQYAYARISGIMRKAGEFRCTDFSVFGADEMSLIRKLSFFPSVVSASKSHLKPSLIARYLLELSQMFNEYYHAVPVLKAGSGVREARLFLLEKIRTTIKTGLKLLDIDVLEEM